jgi:uncharacterized membrane protein YesL
MKKVKSNGVTAFFQYIYQFFKVSFWFWMYLLKGMVIYSLIPAFCALFKTIGAVMEGKEEVNVKVYFKGIYKHHRGLKLQSFLFSLLFIMLYVCLYLLNKWQSDISLILTIVVLYLAVLTSVVFLYAIHFIMGGAVQSFNRILVLSFVQSIRHLWISLFLLLCTGLIAYSALVNLAFFVVFGPFLLGLAAYFLMLKVETG